MAAERVLAVAVGVQAVARSGGFGHEGPCK